MRIKHVTPILAKRYLHEQVRARVPFLRGPSGIGKSECVYAASKLLGEHVPNWKGVIDLRLAQMDPTDLRGIPHVKDGRTHWAIPSFLPQDGAGIIFCDELSSAPPAVQSAAYQLFLTPQDFGIPKEWMIVAAGNNKSDRGVTFNIAAPLQNRVCDISVATNLDDFTEHAIMCNIRPEILSFLRDRADFLHKFEPNGEIKPFPTPRAWFAVSAVLDADMPHGDRVEQINGDVGVEAGTAFEAHMRVYEQIPRIDDILEGKSVKVPTELSARYCVAMGLAVRIDKDNFGNAWGFLQQMPADIQALVVKLAFKRCKDLSSSPDFAKWALQNHKIFSMN